MTDTGLPRAVCDGCNQNQHFSTRIGSACFPTRCV
jgi:hypothetical protein